MTGLLLCLGTRAHALQGNYTGTYTHTEGVATEDVMRHRYDGWTRGTVPGGLDLNLSMSLSHFSRPGIQDSGLLRSRFGADLTGNRWRARGEWTPWQDVSVNPSSPRQRNLSLELTVNPRTLPALGVFYQQFDNASATGRATTRDYRAQASRSFGPGRGYLQFRRLETRAAGRFAPEGHRNEWQGGVSGTHRWGGLTARGSYDGLLMSAADGAATERHHSHRFDLNGTWTASRTLTLSGEAVGRWGTSTRYLTSGTIDERSLTTRALYRPAGSLDFQLAREYRRQQTGALTTLTDFLRLQTTFRHRLRARMNFQAGAVQTVNLGARNATTPSNSVHALLDGRVIRGLEARGEIQAANATGPRMSGIQWRPSVRVRAFPVRSVRVEGAWTRSTLPKLDGLGRTERQWELQAGYQPAPGADLSGTYRWLDVEGRLQQRERYGTVTASWRIGARGRLSVDGTRREAVTPFSRTLERIVGVDAAFGLPSEFRGKASWRASTGRGLPRRTQIAVTVSRAF